MVFNIFVFALYFPMMDGPSIASFFHNWAMIPANITAGNHYYTALTSMFLHGGIMHLAGNMLFLWIFGDNVEDAMGHIPYLIFYLICGIGAGALHIWFNPYSNMPMVGASGAISGVLGAYLLLYPKARVDVALVLIIIVRMFTWPAWVVLSAWMAFQIFGGLLSASTGGGIAYWAHIGGFIVGIVLTFPLWLYLGGPAFWQKCDFRPPNEPTFATRVSTIPIVRRKQ
jgi:rhomboid family protein